MKSIVIILSNFILVLVLLTSYASAAIEITSPTGEEAVISEARDFATLQFADPWDMSNQDDAGLLRFHFRSQGLNSGRWYGSTNNTYASLWLLFGGYPGSYANGREGIINKIHSGVYKRFSLKMYLSKGPGIARLWWFKNKAMTDRAYVNIPVKSGWNIYQVDLPSDKWYGWITGLRIDPVNIKDTRVIIDWARLVKVSNSAVTLQWHDDGLPGLATLYVDGDNDGYDGIPLDTITSENGDNALEYNVSGLPPGNYYLYLNKDGLNSNYSGRLTVNSGPRLKITRPTETTGIEWSSRYSTRWDMNRSSDISYRRNVTKMSFSGGVLTAVNTNNDPIIHLQTLGKNINANSYRFATFRYRYNGDFCLKRGTMARIIWGTKGHGTSISDDIVTYEGWHTYTVDMKKIKLEIPGYGWRGWTTRLRFDPLEDPYRRRFYLDYFKLCAENRCSSSYVIKYRIIDKDSNPVNLKLYYDLDKKFGNGNERLIVEKTVAPGNGAYKWRPLKSLKGRVWIYGLVDDENNSNGFYSKATIRVGF